jgi:hypothetical protein
MKIKICFVLILSLVVVQLSGQDYFFRQYGPSDGLGNSFIYSLSQGKDGYLALQKGCTGLMDLNFNTLLKRIVLLKILSQQFIKTFREDYGLVI